MAKNTYRETYTEDYLTSADPKVHVLYQGWFRPHAPVNWTGEILDRKTGELVKEPSMTKQEFMAECDINNIIKSYSVTGVIAHINEKASQGAYVDLPDPIDFQQGLAMVEAAQASFATLPSSVRNRFDNDPTKFLEFMSDPDNQEEAIRMGLATDNRPPPPETPPKDGNPPDAT